MEHARESALTLPDGRTLAFAELADRTGPPVLVLDGPGSRGLARAAAATGAADGLRLIAPDRPGFGASTSVARIDHAAFAADLVALLDHLGVDATGVVAQSGGTPFALALAASRPDRVRRLSLLGGFAPVHRSSDLDGVAPSAKSGFRLARRAPWLLRVILRRMAARARKDPGEAARTRWSARCGRSWARGTSTWGRFAPRCACGRGTATPPIRPPWPAGWPPG